MVPSFWKNPDVKRLTMLGGWLVVLVLVTSLTWQIVSVADDQVSERPIAPLNVAAPVITDPSSTTSTSLRSTSTTLPDFTTAPPGTVPSTSSTVPATTTTADTTTSSASGWQTRSVQTVGGVVILLYRPGEVAYQSATPAPGFHVEVDKQGPPQVKVEFESQSSKVEVSAEWSDGDLKVEVSEDGDD